MKRKLFGLGHVEAAPSVVQSQLEEQVATSAGAGWKPATGSDALAATFNRRAFLKGSTGLVGGLALAVPLQTMIARKAHGFCGAMKSPYGTPVPTPDHNTGVNLLMLPPGFEYWAFGWAGQPLSDGTPTPSMHDGMAILGTIGSKLVFCRNHEVGAGASFAAGAQQYSPVGAGGNTNFLWDLSNQTMGNSWASLSGTVRNCAGGITPWGTWISSEEVSDAPPDSAGFRHGYNFEVAAGRPRASNAVPLIAMGRFSHEAIVVDPRSGYVYETEDAGGNSGFYRFIPAVPGQLAMGGILQMLKVVGVDQADLRTIGCNETFDVEWVTIENPDAPTGDSSHPDSVSGQGRALGGARFERLEGCWYGLDRIYFLSTSGGPAFEGQVFEYDPVRETLVVIYASPNQAECENPDNIVVTPRGGLLLCEDNAGSTTNPAERLLGLTLDGEIFPFAQNNMDFTPAGLGSFTVPDTSITLTNNNKQNEWAGAVYSPDGQWLFVNIQTPGVTFAIRPIGGDWGPGPL